jgi:hypothetical protein
MTRNHLLALGWILSCLVAADLVAAGSKSKKLIEFGWDEPDTAFLRQHLAEMERTPFDGCVFHANYGRVGGRKGSFTWDGWGTNAFTEADLKAAFDDLKAIRSSRFKHNFLRFNTTPANFDWFDDHAAVLSNARLAARLARAGKCPGLLFDIEQYNAPLFDYRKQRDAKTKSWELYATQVRRRSREVMEAFQDGYPGLTVFLTFCWIYTETPRWWSDKGGPVKLPPAYAEALRKARMK